MSWERDRKNEHVDLALGVHFLPLINPAVKDAEGNPLRFDLKISLGVGMDGQSCPHCHQPIAMTHTLNDRGALVDAKGVELTPAEVAGEYIQRLNGFHGRMEKHAALHGAKVWRGKK